EREKHGWRARPATALMKVYEVEGRVNVETWWWVRQSCLTKSGRMPIKPYCVKSLERSYDLTNQPLLRFDSDLFLPVLLPVSLARSFSGCSRERFSQRRHESLDTVARPDTVLLASARRCMLPAP